jgi:cysteinyl-tRNA synthetase
VAVDRTHEVPECRQRLAGVEIVVHRGLELGASESSEVAVAEDLVELVLDLREREREAGNYERADQLRSDLEALGIEVQDTDDGPTFRFE